MAGFVVLLGTGLGHVEGVVLGQNLVYNSYP